MIKQSELAARARTLRLQGSHALHDYILNHVLASIATGMPELVFRGGTALARVYWPDYRISEDLDFIVGARPVGLTEKLEKVIDRAATKMRMMLELQTIHQREGWHRWLVVSGAGRLQIDVNAGERAYLDVVTRPLTLPYSDLAEESRSIAVVDLHEILANKFFMLTDRDEPRDLFDLWWGLEREGVSFKEIARAHRAKYGHGPDPSARARVHRLERLWNDRLAHQIGDLPPFGVVVAGVERHVSRK